MTLVSAAGIVTTLGAATRVLVRPDGPPLIVVTFTLVWVPFGGRVTT